MRSTLRICQRGRNKLCLLWRRWFYSGSDRRRGYKRSASGGITFQRVNVNGVGGTTLTLNSNGAESSELAWSYSGGRVSEYFTRPSWQTGTGVPSGTMQLYPTWRPADPNNGAVLFYNGAQTVSWHKLSSPTWAGYCALINQARSNAGCRRLARSDLKPIRSSARQFSRHYLREQQRRCQQRRQIQRRYGLRSGDRYRRAPMQALTQTSAGSPDTPTMPQWGLIVMALLLIWVAIRQRARLA